MSQTSKDVPVSVDMSEVLRSVHSLEIDITQIKTTLMGIGGTLDSIDRKIDKLDGRIDRLDGDVKSNFKLLVGLIVGVYAAVIGILAPILLKLLHVF